MVEDLATVFGTLVKYGIYLFFISFGIAIISSIASKIKNEPKTLLKVIFVSLTPIGSALAVPYFLLHRMLDCPRWLNLVVGFFIYAFLTEFLDKRISAKFKDEL